MMSISEVCTFRSKSEAGAVFGFEKLQRKSRWCMIFFADSPALMRCCGHAFYGVGISRKNSLRPCLPALFRSRRVCYRYRYEMDRDDARLERTRLHFAKEGFDDGFSSYKVREGDTLTSVANKFKVSIQSIATMNGIHDIDYIPAGRLLSIPIGELKTGEIAAEADQPLSLMDSQFCEDKNAVRIESSTSAMPAFASAFSIHSWHVKLALSLVLLLAFSSVVRRYISGLRTRRHDEFLQCQIEKEVQEAYHQPRLRRWQGILDDDRRVDEADGDSLADSQAVLDEEEEKLRQTYAQLESAYVKFLADSGLSKSGYWRGGVPPALEET